MPSATVHLKIAYMMKGELGIKNDADFYMGAIAPDAVNLEGFASEEVRYSAHIRSKNYDEWKENIKAFYAEMKDAFNGSEDFFKGYIFHLYTDIAWDEVVQPYLFNFLKGQGYTADQFKEQKWRELYRLNGALAKQEWYPTVLDRLSDGACYDMAGVSAELMVRYKNYVTGAYGQEKMDSDPPEFLNEKHILSAALKALEYFEGLMFK